MARSVLHDSCGNPRNGSDHKERTDTNSVEATSAICATTRYSKIISILDSKFKINLSCTRYRGSFMLNLITLANLVAEISAFIQTVRVK